MARYNSKVLLEMTKRALGDQFFSRSEDDVGMEDEEEDGTEPEHEPLEG